MEPINSIDAEDDQFAYRYDTQLLIDRRDEDLMRMRSQITSQRTLRVTPSLLPAMKILLRFIFIPMNLGRFLNTAIQ